jgi:hypothetical protein
LAFAPTYEFDALYAEAATRRWLMVVTIHDAIDRAARVNAFVDFITYAQRHKGVWFARADAIAQWAEFISALDFAP